MSANLPKDTMKCQDYFSGRLTEAASPISTVSFQKPSFAGQGGTWAAIQAQWNSEPT